MDIATARKARQWTQEDLAIRLGVSRGAVAQWEMEEGGTRPDPDNAMRLVELMPELTLADIYQRKRAA